MDTPKLQTAPSSPVEIPCLPDADSSASSSWRKFATERGLRKYSTHILAALLCVHLLLPFALLRRHSDIPDEDAYRTLAHNIAATHSYHLDTGSFHQKAREPNTYFGPGWPALASLSYWLAAGETGTWVILGLVWALALLAFRRLGSELGLSLSGQLLLTLWFTLNPLLVFYHGHLMSEGLTVLLAFSLISAGILFQRIPSWSHLVALAILSGLGQLCRTTLLLPVAAIWLVAAFTIPRRRLLVTFLAFLLIHGLVIAPWLYRMAAVGAGFTSTELKLGQNLFLYNTTSVRNPYQPQPGEVAAFPPDLEQKLPRERERILITAALADIREHPANYIRMCGLRAYYLLSPVPNFYKAGLVETLGIAGATMIFLYASWLTIGSCLWKKVRPMQGEVTLLGAVLLWYGFHIVIHASGRQRLPSDPWVAVAAVSMVERLRASNYK